MSELKIENVSYRCKKALAQYCGRPETYTHQEVGELLEEVDP